MNKNYTEFRISHKTAEDKKQFEATLDKALKEKGYRNRIEWLNDMYRKLLEGEHK
jgi:metal-responsive CopG/Arc/MetJ family transcriptional regulator